MRLTFKTPYATIIKSFQPGEHDAAFFQHMSSLQARLVDVELL